MIASVKVGAHVYAVVVGNGEEPAEIDFHAGIIRITDRAPPTHQAELLIHEITHALVDNAGYNPWWRTKEGAEDDEDDAEEMLVRAIAPRLAAFMADNPAAVRELLVMLGCEE